MVELSQKLSEYESQNDSFQLSGIIQENGMFSCIVTTTPILVRIADAQSEGGALHIWVDGGTDVGLPVSVQS